MDFWGSGQNNVQLVEGCCPWMSYPMLMRSVSKGSAFILRWLAAATPSLSSTNRSILSLSCVLSLDLRLEWFTMLAEIVTRLSHLQKYGSNYHWLWHPELDRGLYSAGGKDARRGVALLMKHV